ncbi:hypothetical protein ABE426_04345 [Sphingobacterium faecium]|uniref:hypothetical protein n=1 Tax=Sphingobacterium faecium TaxID=34087 RepID=UPI00320A5E8B
MKIEDLEKSDYGNTNSINIDKIPVLFYSDAFYKGEPVGVGVWELDKDQCLSAIINNEDGEKIYLNKINSNDLEMSGPAYELENLFENFLKKSRL